MMREDWIEVKLGDAFFTTSGGTPSRKVIEYFNGNIPWVKSGELNYNIIKDTEEHISEEAIKNSSAKIFPEETLLIALYGATIGKLAILGVPAATNQAICGIYKNNNFLTKFVYYFLLYKKPSLIGQGMGGAQSNISQTILKRLLVPVVSKPEQRAIVAKIEELFSELDSGIDSLKKARKQLEVYRQAVLKSAFEGKLTKEWRDKNISTELQNEWMKRKLGDVCDKANKINKKNLDKHEQFIYIDIGSIDNKIYKITSHKVYKWEDAPSRAQQIIKLGDVLFSTVRTYLKNIARVTDSIHDNQICSSGFTVIRGNEKLLDSKFIFYFIIYEGFLQPLNKLQTGTSYPAVRDGDVFEQIIPIPLLKEQHQIVQEIESRLSVCENIESNIEEALEKAEGLRQSILKKAFEGKLLSKEELEACKLQDDWEPAAELLKRIKKTKKEAKK